MQERIYALESNLEAAQADKDKCSAAFESMRAEYDSYKVRVHSVLKNQKSKSSMQTQLDNERRERYIY